MRIGMNEYYKSLEGGIRVQIFQEFTSLADLKNAALKCQTCHLRQTCQGVVFGEGDENADVMIIGEGPGAREDDLGRPFVGRAGELLTKMLTAIQFDRSEVYITNIVKCRPPDNRTPTQQEMDVCLPILRQQVKLIKPPIIVLLGSASLKGLIDKNLKITQVRGTWFEKKGVNILPTYHPAFLLRNPAKKREAWEDLKALQAKYDALS